MTDRTRIRYGRARGEDKRNGLLDACEEMLEDFKPFRIVLKYEEVNYPWESSDPEIRKRWEVGEAWDQHEWDDDWYYSRGCWFESWEDWEMEKEHRGPYCDPIPHGEQAHEAMERELSDPEAWYYWSLAFEPVQVEPLQDQIEQYEEEQERLKAEQETPEQTQKRHYWERAEAA